MIAMAAALLLAPNVCLVAEDGALKDVHSVGVISAMGNDMIVSNLGVTIFTNASGSMTLDWNIDSEIVARVSNALKDRFTIVPATADAVKLLALARSGWSNSDMQKYIRGVTPANPVDAYVLVTPALKTAPVMGKALSSMGFGFVRIENLFDLDFMVLTYVSYEIRVVDAKTGKTLEWYSGAMPYDGIFRPATIMAVCDNSLRAKTPADVTECKSQPCVTNCGI
jgi:hypothetical protein